MTTVVATLEGMAADHRCTSGGPILHAQKIHRIRGCLYGIAGDIFVALIVLEWLKGKRDPEALHKLIPPDHRDAADILELSSKGLALWNGWGIRLELMDNNYAIGTGAMPALTHVKIGESLDKAIKYASVIDECSGVFLAPQVEWLKPKK